MPAIITSHRTAEEHLSVEAIEKLIKQKAGTGGIFRGCPHRGGLTEYLHKAIHEEWQVGHTPYLRAETLHFRVE